MFKMRNSMLIDYFSIFVPIKVNIKRKKWIYQYNELGYLLILYKMKVFIDSISNKITCTNITNGY